LPGEKKESFRESELVKRKKETEKEFRFPQVAVGTALLGEE